MDKLHKAAEYLIENWEIYSVLPKAFPSANKFLSIMKYSTPNTADTDWIKTKAFPDDQYKQDHNKQYRPPKA